MSFIEMIYIHIYIVENKNKTQVIFKNSSDTYSIQIIYIFVVQKI